MSRRAGVALVTHVHSFAGPPAVKALSEAGLRVLAHDPAFADPNVRDRYAKAHSNVQPLAAQTAEDLHAEILRHANTLEVLISNDSFPAIHGPIATAELADLRETLERLVVFPFALAKALIPMLRASVAARVVLITSSRTRLPRADGAIPDAARAAANALVKSLSLELAADGIPVNAIAPNFLYSETYYPRAVFMDDPAGQAFVASQVPIGRLGLPEEIGELIVYLATMRGCFLTGSIIDFTGGWPAGIGKPP